MKKPGLFVYNETKPEAALPSSNRAESPRDSVPVGKVRMESVLTGTQASFINWNWCVESRDVTWLGLGMECHRK